MSDRASDDIEGQRKAKQGKAKYSKARRKEMDDDEEDRGREQSESGVR